MPSPITVPRVQFLDGNGKPVVGGWLYSYVAGTTTPLPTYADSAGSTPNPNPVQLDANGQAVIWLGDTQDYDFRLENASHVTMPTPGLDVSSFSRVASLIRADLSGVNGAGQIGYSPGQNYADGTVGEALARMRSPRDFGAKGDFNPATGQGTDDYVALQAWANYCANNGGIGVIDRNYRTSRSIVLVNPPKGFRWLGSSGGACGVYLRASSDQNVFNIIGPHDTTIEGFTIDGGQSQTGFSGHTISIRNPRHVSVRNVHSQNFKLSAGMMFADAPRTYGYSQFIDCTFDGGGTGQNGHLLVDLMASSIVRPVGGNLSTSGSPCYGAQLKNECVDSHIVDAVIEKCKGGLVLASDATNGPDNCSMTGIVRDCTDLVLLGKSKNCRVVAQVDGANNAAISNAVEIGANCSGNNVRVSIDNMHSSVTAILVRSDDNMVTVERAGAFGAKLLELSEGVDRCRIFVQNVDVNDILPYITNNSGTNTNEVIFARSVSQVIGGDGANGDSYMRFDGITSFISYDASEKTFIHRVDGANAIFLKKDSISPGVDDFSDCGAASFRFKNFRGSNGSIVTSDEREKTEIDAVPDAVLDAWLSVPIKKYRRVGGDRVHVGRVAQDVEAAFVGAGLDPFAYAVLCKETVLRDGVMVERLSIRPEEANALDIACWRRTLA